MKHFLLVKDLAWVLADLQVATGVDVPQGNTQRRGNAKAYGYIAESIDRPNKLIKIVAKYDQKHGQEAVDALNAPDAAQIQQALDDAAVGFHPQRLWDAICDEAKGPIKEMSGKDLYSEMRSLKFDETGNYEDRVDNYIEKIRNLLQRADTINDPNYVITEAVLCEQFIDDMSRRFKKQKAAYRDIRTVHQLEDQAHLDARDFDRDTDDEERPLRAMGATTSTVADDTPVTMSQIKQMFQEFKSGKPNARSERYESKARRMNFDAGGVGQDVWCSNHGWGKHDNKDCRLNTKPKQQVGTNASKKITLLKNADDTYSMMTNVTHANVAIRAL
ncbi:MAG: hypothetical protein COB29_01230, partial [Sulfitobacter sp.]